jgi:hypothetical protein
MAYQDRARTPQEALYPTDELEEVLGQERRAELKQECTEEILLLHLFNEFEWETSLRKKRIDIVDLSSSTLYVAIDGFSFLALHSISHSIVPAGWSRHR